MSICQQCGQKITFRYINGVCVPIHGPGACENKARKTLFIFIECPTCHKMAYYVRPAKGGCFWADEPGKPWPKHPCFDPELNPVNAEPTEITKTRKNKNGKHGDTTISSADLSALGKQGRRLCNLCNVIFDEDRYSHHLRTTVHKTAEAALLTKRGRKRSKFRKDTVKPHRSALRIKRPHKTASPTNPSPIARTKDEQDSKPKRATVSSDLDAGRLKPMSKAPLAAISSPNVIALDKQGRRRCDFCKARVRPHHYGQHLKKVHRDKV